MGIDASIYNNVQTPQVKIPNPVDYAEQGMRLSTLGMQQAQMVQQMRVQQVVRQAYMDNTDPDTGQLNRQGAISQIGQQFPEKAQEMANGFAQQDKAKAEAQAAQMEAQQKIDSVMMPRLQYLSSADEDQKPALYQSIISQAAKEGHPVSQAPANFSQSWLDQTIGQMKGRTENINNQKTQADTQKTIAETAAIPGQNAAKLQGELYGSRSANAELSSQYNDQAKAIRPSATAMNQMIDNYKNPSPQGDASLVLNAFKIKFPNQAPDVNSLEELSKSQAASDQWKQMANKALSGGLDKSTRDNLMRDGVSTFRANYQTLQDVKQRMQARQSQQGINDPSLTYEPGMDATYKNAMDMQKQIGPYVPPSERGGIMGGLNKAASVLMGTSESKDSNAPPPAEKTIKMMSPGGKIKLVPLSQKGEAIAAGGKVVQ